MRVPLPVRVLAHDSGRLHVGVRTLLRRLWAHLCEGQTPEACLSRARARAALRAEYGAYQELYPARRGRRAPWTLRRGGDQP